MLVRTQLRQGRLEIERASIRPIVSVSELASASRQLRSPKIRMLVTATSEISADQAVPRETV